MRPSLATFVLLFAGVVGLPDLPAQAPSIALLPFSDGGSYGLEPEEYQAWTLAIPALVGSSLARQPAATVIAGTAVSRALDSIRTRGDLDRVDAGTAATVADGAGAAFALTGSFADIYDNLRLDARVIDSRSGAIVAVVSATGTRQGLAAMAVDLARQVRSEIALAEASEPDPSAATTTAAVTLLGRGLVAERQGSRDQAADHLRRALAESPSLSAAADALARLQ